MTTRLGPGGPQADLDGSRARITNRARLDGDGPVAKGAARDQVRKETPMPPLILSSDSHVFEPPDLWQTRIDAAFRDRAPRIQRIDGTDYIVVEADQILSGIGLISYAVFCLKKKNQQINNSNFSI